MPKQYTKLSQIDKELAAELLKERIYATLALLAVLISIDANRSTPFHTALIVGGTIISLWAASLVATLMSRRVIYQGALDHSKDKDHQLRKHAPMLAALVFPLLMILFAAFKVISLGLAINISISSALLLLIGWSVLSARSIHASRTPTIVLILAELSIGLGVVFLKVLLGH